MDILRIKTIFGVDHTQSSHAVDCYYLSVITEYPYDVLLDDEFGIVGPLVAELQAQLDIVTEISWGDRYFDTVLAYNMITPDGAEEYPEGTPVRVAYPTPRRLTAPKSIRSDNERQKFVFRNLVSVDGRGLAPEQVDGMAAADYYNLITHINRYRMARSAGVAP